MKKRTIIICSILVIILLSALLGFGLMKNSADTKPDDLSENYGEMIFEEKVSPNENYVENKEDAVYYELKIYQNSENVISVLADSNSEFFEKLYYQVECDQPITEENITVEWTTLMGSTQPTKDNQAAIADVKLSSSGGEVFSERKINFVKRGFEIINEAVK